MQVIKVKTKKSEHYIYIYDLRNLKRKQSLLLREKKAPTPSSTLSCEKRWEQLMLFLKDSDQKGNCTVELNPAESRRAEEFD